MTTALSILSSLGFKQLRPGENDKDFKFSGPGVVVLACQNTSCPPSEIHFKLITAVSADSDALDVAFNLLSQNRSCDGHTFALLASVPEKEDRISAVATLGRMCSEGI